MVGATLGIMRRPPCGLFGLAGVIRLCLRRKIIPRPSRRAFAEAHLCQRAAKNFQRADEIRAGLKELGVGIDGRAQGTTWRVV